MKKNQFFKCRVSFLILSLYTSLSGNVFAGEDFGITDKQFLNKFNQNINKDLGLTASMEPMPNESSSDKTMLIMVDDYNGVVLALSDGTSKVKEVTAIYRGAYDESDSIEEKAIKASIPLYMYSSVVNITSPSVSMDESFDMVLGLMSDLSNAKDCGEQKIFNTKTVKYIAIDVCSGGKMLFARPL